MVRSQLAAYGVDWKGGANERKNLEVNWPIRAYVQNVKLISFWYYKWNNHQPINKSLITQATKTKIQPYSLAQDFLVPVLNKPYSYLVPVVLIYISYVH